MPGDPGSDEDGTLAGLPDDVRELVVSVQARARQSPRPQQIRALADEKRAQSAGDPVTVAQINTLAGLAEERSGQVADLAAQLAELVGSSHG